MIWQYHTEVFLLDGGLQHTLNDAGKYGWELASAVLVPVGGSAITGQPPKIGMQCVFKRPVDMQVGKRE